MKIKTEEIKRFKQVCASVKTNQILPVLSYLKMEGGKIIKSNLESFVKMDTSWAGEDFLILEKDIFSFIEFVSADEISIDVDVDRILIKDGQETLSSPTDPVENYPKMPVAASGEILLSSAIMKEIEIACNFVTETSFVPVARCIFLGGGIVGASTGDYSYVNKIGEFPKMVIEKTVANVVKNLGEVLFSENDSYQFYVNPDCVFGFCKKEVKFFDLNKFGLLPEGESVQVNKSELVKFAEICNSVSQSDVIFIKDREINMQDDFGKKYNKPLSVNMPDFTFRTSILLKTLKALPDEILNFSFSQHRVYITGSGSYVSIITEFSKA